MKKVFENRSVVVKQSIVKQPKTGEKLLRAGIRKAFLSTLLLSPVLAHALGLGALTTNSSLNEPFDARIELLNTSSEELQTLSVTLGGVEQFKNAGIERPFLLSSLKFVIIEDLAGSYLQITSDESIKEPFLNFLLEVNWAKGRLIREYTALLDPPVFDTNTRIADTTEMAVSEPEMPIAVTEPVPAPTPAPVTPAPVQPEKENIRIEQLPDATLVSDAEVQSGSMVESNTVSTTTIPVAEPVSHEEPVVYQETFQQQRSQPSFSGDNYTTSRGDTLWAIARQSRPSRSVSVQQMMLSLLNTNPNAFINSNINNLKTGQVLRIPDSSEINQLSKREAIALVKEHNALWDDYRQGLASNVAPRPAGAVSSVGTVVENDVVEEEVMEEPEVRLVTATMDDVTVFEEAATGSGDVNEGMTEDVLENDLALANEQLVSGQSENAELRDKLRESEEITELLKQQVALKNQELAALQQKLREANIAKPESETVYLEEEAVIPEEVKEPEVAEEIKPEIEEEPEVAEEPKPEESIDDILAELEQGKEPESETVYLEHSEELTSTTTDYGSYDAPAESLAGKETTTVYFDADDATTPVEPVQSDVTETPAVAEVETEQPVEEIVVDEPQAETGLLDKITAMLPAGIVDSVPGGIKTVLAVILGLLGLLLVGVLKMFGGKGKDNAEILDLLDPEELDDTEDVFSTTLDDMTDEIVPDELLDQETVEVAADSFDAKVAEEFDLDFEEEITDDFTPDATGEIEIPDLLDGDMPEELESSEGLVNLEDTLEQIKPLLEQTEEELEEDPLEEVNLSLAYEQFDKAETLVNQAIKDHPEEDGYKLRLLEVHYAANNKEAYEDAAKSLHEAIGGEGHLWESAVAMWSEMSPERDLFEDAEPAVADVSSAETLETTTPTESPVSENEEEGEDDGVFDISSSGTTGIIAGMSAAGAGIGAAILGADDSDDDSEFINIADETTSLEDTEMIDISAGEVETSEVEDDFLNIAETGEVEDDFLNIAGEETGDSLLEQTQPNVEEDLSIDMLDITAVGSTDADTDTGSIDIAVDADTDTDAEELFELTNEFKTVDENILSATSVESEGSAEILEFSSDDVAEITKESLDVESTVDVSDATEEALSLDGDDDLESLAKSLEDTISGLDTGGLDDLTFEFDPDGTLESTLTSTLGVASDIDLENEGDEIDTKLNLAKAYIELGDSDGAKDILQEVSSDGSDDQKKDALDLLQQIS